MICYTASTCLECGQPFGKCICQQRFKALVDPGTAARIIAARMTANEDETEEGNPVNLLLQVNKLAQKYEFISLLSLCYDVGSKSGRGFPYVDDLQWALDTLEELGQIETTGDDRYRAVPGAPVLAVA